MRAFDSIAKKLAIPMVVLFEIGWIVYIGGFGSYMHQRVLENAELRSRGYTSVPNADEILRNPVLFPFYFTLVGGQFVALLFLLHAALPSSVIGYIVGVLSSVLNIIYFVSVGYLIHWSAPLVKYLDRSIRESQQSPSYGTDDLERAITDLHALRCILSGAIIMAVSWGVIQLLFFFYEDKSDSQNQRSLWRVIREFAADLPASTSQLKASPGELLRLCIIPLLVLSAVGWCVCVVGLDKLNDHIIDTASTSTSYFYYSTTLISYRYDFGSWATFFVVPVLYLAALLHSGFSGDASTMSGAFAAIFNTFFVLSVGFKVLDISIVIYNLQSRTEFSRFYTTDPQVTHSNNLILGGGVVCLFFWTIVHAAWHFYRCAKGSRNHTRLQPHGSDDHSQAVQQYAYDTSVVPEQQLPPYAKHMEAEMQPVAN